MTKRAGDCVDAFVIAALTRLLPKRKRRYHGGAWQHYRVNETSPEDQAVRFEARDVAVSN